MKSVPYDTIYNSSQTISLPAAEFWVTCIYIGKPGGTISPSWADRQWVMNSSDSSHSTESTFTNTKVEEVTTIQIFSSAFKFGKCFQYRITEWIRLEATTVAHVVSAPAGSSQSTWHRLASRWFWNISVRETPHALWAICPSVTAQKEVLHIQAEQNITASTQAEVLERKPCSTITCNVVWTIAPSYQHYTIK